MLIDRHLIERVEAVELGRDRFVDVLDRLGDAFAEVALLVAVAQFERFVFAGARAARDRRAADRAAGEMTSTSTVGLPRESRISRA